MATPTGVVECNQRICWKFWLIPEFVGRFPVITTPLSDPTDMPALIRVLTEPRHAPVKSENGKALADRNE
jgi:ATP-dependent protease Clp ATPase subunit